MADGRRPTNRSRLTGTDDTAGVINMSSSDPEGPDGYKEQARASDRAKKQAEEGREKESEG